MATFDTEAVKDQLEDLHEALDVMQKALVPLNLQQTGSSLLSYSETEQLDPIAKAKMLVTVAYAIDSLLFSKSIYFAQSAGLIRVGYLKVTGIKTETHTIMNELQRIKQYVGKIKGASAHEKRKMTLDKKATARIIDHDLSSNASHDRQRALETAQTNQRLEVKLASLAASNIGKHTRFQNSAIMQEATERLHNSAPTLNMDAAATAMSSQTLEKPDIEKMLTTSSSTKRARDSSDDDERPVSADPVPAKVPGMFHETKAEKKARERKERKTAKRVR